MQAGSRDASPHGGDPLQRGVPATRTADADRVRTSIGLSCPCGKGNHSLGVATCQAGGKGEQRHCDTPHSGDASSMRRGLGRGSGNGYAIKGWPTAAEGFARNMCSSSRRPEPPSFASQLSLHSFSKRDVHSINRFRGWHKD